MNPESSPPLWHVEAAAAAMARLETPVEGLSYAAAAGRLATHGPNQLSSEEAVGPWTLLLDQFKSFIIRVLLAAAIVTGMLGERVDCIVILAIVLLNALMGFFLSGIQRGEVARGAADDDRAAGPRAARRPVRQCAGGGRGSRGPAGTGGRRACGGGRAAAVKCFAEMCGVGTHR